MKRWSSRGTLAGLLSGGALFIACQKLPPTKPLESDGTGGGAQGGTGGGAQGGTGAGSAGVSGDSTAGGSAGSAGTMATEGGESAGGSAASGGDAGMASGGKAGGGAGRGGSKSGGEAGAPEGGASDGGAGTGATGHDEFFGASRCSSAFDFCEDFESGTLSSSRWQIQSSGQDPVVETTRAARGAHSVHFHTDDNGLSLLHTRTPFPRPNNKYYGRLFVWFDSMPTAPTWAHWSIAASDSDSEETEIRVGGQYDNTKNRFGVGTDHGPTGDWTNLDQDPGDPVPVRTWVCVEWLHDGETDQTDLWWDGVARPSLHTTATDHGGSSSDYTMPPIDSAWIGWWLYQAGTTPDHFDVSDRRGRDRRRARRLRQLAGCRSSAAVRAGGRPCRASGTARAKTPTPCTRGRLQTPSLHPAHASRLTPFRRQLCARTTRTPNRRASGRGRTLDARVGR